MTATRLGTAGRIFVGVSLIGLAFTHFMVREFTTGRAPPWPTGVPGGVAWAYVTGILIGLVGLSVLAGRQTRPILIGAGVLIAAWALMRLLPIVATDSILGGSWTRAGKALTFFGGMFALAGSLPRRPHATEGRWWATFINHDERFITFARVCLAVFLLVAGLQHFKYTPFVASLIPGWIPGSGVVWARFAGVALLCGGLGLLFPRTTQLAALLSGLMIFSWFWIVHIPRSLGAVTDRIAVWEALAVSGIALVIAGQVERGRERVRSRTAS